MPKVIEVADVHSLKVNQILYSRLSPEQAIRIAQDFHTKHNLVGMVNTNIGSLRFDEYYPNKYDIGDIFDKAVWEIKVEYGAWWKRYILYVDDESGEVLACHDGVFMVVVKDSVFSDSKIKVLNKDYDDLYPCYLKKSDYDDPGNVSRLRVLDEYRQEFVEKYPFYYSDESVFGKGNKLFGFLMKVFGRRI